MSQSKVPCISCRLRRKKCDRRLPFCGRCQRLGIPSEWCIYKESVCLQEKDSAVTLEQAHLRNRELKRQYEHSVKLLDFLQRSQQEGTAPLKRKHQRTEPKKVVPQAPNDVYLGMMGVSKDCEWGLIFTIFKASSKERARYINEKIPKQKAPREALLAFEEKCQAAAAGQDVSDGPETVKKLVLELMDLIPNRSFYQFLWSRVALQNTARFAIGMPFYHTELLEAVRDVILFHTDGTPYPAPGLHKNPKKLVHLSMCLMVLAIGHFIESRRLTSSHKYLSPEVHWGYMMCIRYADALLQARVLDPSVDLDKDEPSVLLTVALYQLHVFKRHTVSTSFRTDLDKPQHTAMITRYLIHRCKRHHIHQNLELFYPNISKDEQKTLKSVLYGLAILETVNSIDFGMVSSIQCDAFAYEALASLRTPVCDAIRAIHCVLNDLNFLDGGLSANVIVEATEDSLRKIQRAYEGLGPTLQDDIDEMRSVNSRRLAGDPECFCAFYSAAERVLLRGLLLGVCQCACAMQMRVLELLGESAKDSKRAQHNYIRALKYALVLIYHFRLLLEVVHEVGNDLDNESSHRAFLAIIHFITPIEYAGLRKAVRWTGHNLRHVVDLTDQECTDFFLYHESSLENDKAIVEAAKERCKEHIPKFEDLVDFGLDWDTDRLESTLGKLTDEKVMATVFASEFVKMRELFQSKAISLNFMKMTNAFAFGIRYSSLGIRYFFPDVVRAVESQSDLPSFNPPPENTSDKEDGEVDFAGTFRDLFEAVFDTTSHRELHFGTFFWERDDHPSM